jgi:isopentenyldiphosphate isomerase
MAAPLIQIVDEQDRPIGGATKQQAWDEGLMHRIARAMVQDENGRLLLQKRAPHKQPYPNHWDWVPAGHVDEGETYEVAMRREANEELGLNSPALQFEVAENYRSNKVFEGRQLNRFNRVFRLTIDSATALSLDSSEATELRWFTVPELRDMLASHPNDFTSSVQSLFARHYSA